MASGSASTSTCNPSSSTTPEPNLSRKLEEIQLEDKDGKSYWCTDVGRPEIQGPMDRKTTYIPQQASKDGPAVTFNE
jgi:hypothetical protein